MIFSLSFHIFPLFFTLLVFSHAVVENYPNWKQYCNMHNGKNTLCKFGPNCTTTACRKDIIPIDEGLRKLFLQTHNSIRNKFALGKIENYEFMPKAANMRLLNYDMELEHLAQCWAMHMCHMKHDLIRNTLDKKWVGQNIYSFYFNPEKEASIRENVKSAVKTWFSAIRHAKRMFSYRNIAGHFAQVVWAKTSHIGCGIGYRLNNNQVYIVCNYKPGGVIPYAKVYEQGEPCSKCPKGVKCNPKFKGLCGEDLSGLNLTYNQYLVPKVGKTLVKELQGKS